MKNHLEANIKREITKVYKQSFGKGPGHTTVMIYEKLVILTICGALSQIEETLMKTAEGVQIVEKIRDQIVLAQTDLYVPIVEKIVNEQISKVSYIMDEKSNTMYVFLLFEKEICTIKGSPITE